MNTLMILPLAALALAVSAYAYLAKRQPEYPNARVIAVFTLLGGGLGGLLVLLALLPIGLVEQQGLGELWGLGMALGVVIGTLPAAVCGVLLAFLRAAYSGGHVAVAAGALASAAMGLVWAHDGIVAVWTACTGGLSAAILSAIVLPKAL